MHVVQLIDSEQVLFKEGSSDHLQLVPTNLSNERATAKTDRRPHMKKIVLAVALVLSFAAPAMAGSFPNLYATNVDAKMN
jgi:hypothetical protein